MTRAQLLFLVVGLPMGELLSILLGAQYMGALATFALIVVDVFIGSALLKKAGRLAFSTLRREASTGALDGRLLKGSSRLAIAGLLLIIPGFVSDILAFILLLPVLHHLIILRTDATPRPERPRGPMVVDLDPTDYRQLSADEEAGKNPPRKRRLRDK